MVTVNGAVDRDVSFTVRTALGNASGTLVEPYTHKNMCFFPRGRFCCRLALIQTSCMFNYSTDILDYIPFTYDKMFIPNGLTRICVPLTFQNDSIVEDTEFFYAELMVDGDISTDSGNTTMVFIADANGIM